MREDMHGDGEETAIESPPRKRRTLHAMDVHHPFIWALTCTQKVCLKYLTFSDTLGGIPCQTTARTCLQLQNNSMLMVQ
jgi:hypothetical protein